jgi:hypothetical protein
MYDVIECFPSAVQNKQTRLLVFQSRDADTATKQAEELWRKSEPIKGSSSTFLVVDRSTARELCRMPAR